MKSLLRRWIQYNALTKIWTKAARAFAAAEQVHPKSWSLTEDQKAVVLAPHPDDETFGAGAFLAKYGSQCEVILLTQGEQGIQGLEKEETAAIRKVEFLNALECLGVSKQHCLEIPDGGVEGSQNSWPLDVLQSADWILLPNPFDQHPDHQAVLKGLFQLVDQRKLSSEKRVVFYEVWNPLVAPTHFIDLSDVAEKKLLAMSCYESQIHSFDYRGAMMALHRYRGLSCSCELAEGFVVMSLAQARSVYD